MKTNNNPSLINKAFDSLKLKKPLIGIAFADNHLKEKLLKSKSIHKNKKVVPAGCSFWEMATKRLFYTEATDHAHCSIGLYTHNLIRGEEDKSQLMKDISLMKKIDYVRMEEVATIPALKKKPQYIIYGPWKDFQATAIKKLGISPEIAFVFADSEKGLIFTEAVSRVDGPPSALGRPACAIIPHVVNTGKAAVSFGCCGARAYVLSLGNESDLWVFPGEKLTDYAKAISVFTKANQILSSGHGKREKTFRKGKNLALEQALNR